MQYNIDIHYTRCSSLEFFTVNKVAGQLLTVFPTEFLKVARTGPTRAEDQSGIMS